MHVRKWLNNKTKNVYNLYTKSYYEIRHKGCNSHPPYHSYSHCSCVMAIINYVMRSIQM